MGWRFRRSFKIAPGVKVNFNKKSLGLTIGVRGAHYTLNTKRQQTSSLGIPGTGLYYSETKRLSLLNEQNRNYVKANKSTSFSFAFFLRNTIDSLLSLLNMDNWGTKKNISYRPEPQFISANIKRKSQKDCITIIPDDNTILNNLYTIIPEVNISACNSTLDTSFETSSKENEISTTDTEPENAKANSDTALEPPPYRTPNSVQGKRGMSKSELDAFLWQCNSVCDARDYPDTNFNMRLDNPNDLLETGYYYAMKDISDNKETDD